MSAVIPASHRIRSLLSRNAEIVREDDPANHVYQIISGAVCTYRTLREGRRQIAGFYFAGDVFGLEAVETHRLTAQAITTVAVRLVKKQALNALMSSNHELSDHLLSLMARELARKQNQVLVLSRSAYERVICFLVEMAQRLAASKNCIELPMSRQDTADYLGLTIETVSRVFWDLERRGAIKMEGRHSIVLLQIRGTKAPSISLPRSGVVHQRRNRSCTSGSLHQKAEPQRCLGLRLWLGGAMEQGPKQRSLRDMDSSDARRNQHLLARGFLFPQSRQ